tara:strand:- start:3 stop:737 length:735 start_codon:yes stop_codon:yes gene_type:complete
MLINKGNFNDEIKGICEYIDIPNDQIMLNEAWQAIMDKENKFGIGEKRALVNCHSHDQHNVFGKTKWKSYALADLGDQDNGNAEIYESLLVKYRKVHPDMQLRSTGFNFSNDVTKELYVHTDLDPSCEHPNYFNIVLPVFGASRIDYYETRSEEVWLPERNAKKEYYYHEFKPHLKFDKEFNKSRQIGHVHVDKPVLIDTDVLHGVQLLEAPRLAFVVRYNNIPKEMDFKAFKAHAERVLNEVV